MKETLPHKRALRAVELRRAGVTFRAIAEELHSNSGTVHRWVRKLAPDLPVREYLHRNRGKRRRIEEAPKPPPRVFVSTYEGSISPPSKERLMAGSARLR